jgi:hypothetical protein
MFSIKIIVLAWIGPTSGGASRGVLMKNIFKDFTHLMEFYSSAWI